MSYISQHNLTIHRPQIDQHCCLLQVNVLLHRFLLWLERVEPRERDGVDMVLIERDREASLDEVEGFEVILEEVAMSGGSRVGRALQIDVVLLWVLEIVLEVLSFALGVIESDVVVERLVELNGSGFFLADCKHGVGRR